MLACLVGLGVWFLAAGGFVYFQVVGMKLWGAAPECPWKRVLSLPGDAGRFGALQTGYLSKVPVVEADDERGIQRVASPLRPFWVSKAGGEMSGPDLIAYLLTEHSWVEERHAAELVQAGDTVIDCGAHVGVFTASALRRGARRVIMIEPDPVNVECLRRNFRAELESGRVTLVPEGAWSEHGTIELHTGVANSGTGSMMHKEEGSVTVRVPVRPIDDMVRTLGVERVDFIKMDIEGAEREALKGAARTLAKFRPRLMLDSYHLPDDPVVLPALIRKIEPSYAMTCGPCELNMNEREARIMPHVTFYRSNP